MRINEIITETVNPDILNPEFQHKQRIGDFLYTAQTSISDSGFYTYLLIRCYDGDKMIGKVNFEVRTTPGMPSKKWLESQMTEVDSKYHQKGIASTMYAYAKMLGNDVKPSRYQSDMGKDMWKGWRKSGAAKQLMREEINPDCLNPAFNDTQIFDGFTYRATVDQGQAHTYLVINVLDDNFNRIGFAKFKPNKSKNGEEYLESLITSVDTPYRGKNIASNIYAYVRMLGNTIKPSTEQLPGGKAMWDAWEKSGEAKHLTK